MPRYPGNQKMQVPLLGTPISVGELAGVVGRIQAGETTLVEEAIANFNLACIACGGSGKSSRGGECYPYQGTGRKQT